MTIKQKLRNIFFSFFSLVMMLIVWLILSLFLQQKYFEEYIELRDRLSLLDNILQIVNSQKLHFDYYILLLDEKERENFNLYINNIKKIEQMYLQKTNDNFVTEKYNGILELAERVFLETDRVQKVKIAMDKFLPLYESFVKDINGRKEKYWRYTISSRKNIKVLYILNWIISTVIILISIFIILNYGVKIYNSLINPLKTMVEFANVLSKGDYKTIDITTKDEFSEVISAFNHMVNSLKKLQAQILQMDRLSNIGQLAGGVAHELNNPLVGVLGQTQILLEKLPENSPLKEHVLKIERAAKRCKESITTLLRFSRQKEYEYTEADINDIVKSVLFIADSELKANNIEVRTMFSDNLPKVKVSIPHIQQAVLNIINNSIQAISDKGNILRGSDYIIVKTYETETQESSDLQKYIITEIQDTGCGIEKENFKLIFEPFFTTKNKNKFAGMGLSITKDIILHHKGKISVFSEGKNKGARFLIYLPI
ncbi:MAG: ATP-binding protein [Endomicrobia bacterium]|nr:ATP-binding protein [Endomicrobiia bacterium]